MYNDSTLHKQTHLYIPPMRPDEVGIMSQLESHHLPARATHDALQILKYFDTHFAISEVDISHDALGKHTAATDKRLLMDFRVCAPSFC